MIYRTEMGTVACAGRFGKKDIAEHGSTVLYENKMNDLLIKNRPNSW